MRCLKSCNCAVMSLNEHSFIGVRISSLGANEASMDWSRCLNELTSEETSNVQKFLFFDDKKRAAASLLLQKYVIRKTFAIRVNDCFRIARTVEVLLFHCQLI